MDLSKLSDADLEALAANDLSKMSEEGLRLIANKPAPEEPSLTAKGFDYLGRGIDYLGGLARTGAAGLADPAVRLATGESLLKEGDVGRALRGRAPGSAEFLERAGIPEGSSVNLMPEVKIPFTDVKLGEGETSARDATGFALDIASDPLTYATFGAKPLLAAALKPTAKLAEKAGEKIYRAGFKKVDERLALEAGQPGARQMSDLGLKYGIYGDPEQIALRMKELEKELAAKRGRQYQEASDLGAKISMRRAARPAIEKAQEISSSPLAPISQSGDAMLDYLQKWYMQTGKQSVDVPIAKEIMERDALSGELVARRVPLDYPQEGKIITQKIEQKFAQDLPPISLQDASDAKTYFYEQLPDKFYANKSIGKLTADSKQVARQLGKGIKEEIEDVANKVKPGLGDEIRETNKEWGTLLEARKPISKEISKENTRNALSSVDTSMLGYVTVNPTRGVPVLVGKKIGDLGKLMKVRTGAGLGLERYGTGRVLAPSLDILLRQQLSPWLQIKEEEF
jgi:hypothetical protein